VNSEASSDHLIETARLILENPEGVLAAAYEQAKSEPEILKDYGHAFFLAGRLIYHNDHDLRRAGYYLLQSSELAPVCSCQAERDELMSTLMRECHALPTPWDDAASIRSYNDANEISSWTEQTRDEFFRRTRRGEIRRSIVEFALEYYKPGMNMLELGCAAGGYFGTLRRFVGDFEYVGIDLSPGMIAAAQTNFPGADFRVGDAGHLAFLDDAFDFVLAIDIISFVRNWEQVLREAYRVTRKYFVMRVRTLVEDLMPTQVLTVGNQWLSYPYIIFNRTELAACLNSLQPAPAGHKIVRHIHDISPTQDAIDLLQYRLPMIKRDDGTICINDALDLAIMKY
jgi:ubiquinone/menaquinone biosynthesis C-methylase UbiE